MKVVVLMSTWQGERFVAEQMRSILDQLPDNGRVIVRDDGSTDNTVVRIQSLDDNRVSIERGVNIGFSGSFLALLDSAPVDADIVMLSDQDDIWMPDKIARAVSCLTPFASEPTLYCCPLELVDELRRPLGRSPVVHRRPSLRNALAENIVTGCTCALNRAALPLVRSYGDPSLIYFHDWWLYLVVSAFGRVLVDDTPHIWYRQHSANAIGMGAGFTRYFAIFRFLGRKNWVHIMYEQIENFLAVHGTKLNPADLVFVQRYFDPHRPASVLRLLFTPRRFRQTLIYDVLLRLLILGSLVSGRGLSGTQKRDSKRSVEH